MTNNVEEFINIGFDRIIKEGFEKTYSGEVEYVPSSSKRYSHEKDFSFRSPFTLGKLKPIGSPKNPIYYLEGLSYESSFHKELVSNLKHSDLSSIKNIDKYLQFINNQLSKIINDVKLRLGVSKVDYILHVPTSSENYVTLVNNIIQNVDSFGNLSKNIPESNRIVDAESSFFSLLKKDPDKIELDYDQVKQVVNSTKSDKKKVFDSIIRNFNKMKKYFISKGRIVASGADSHYRSAWRKLKPIFDVLSEDNLDMNGKTVLIFDDTYDSGVSIKHSIEVLAQQFPNANIFGLVLFKKKNTYNLGKDKSIKHEDITKDNIVNLENELSKFNKIALIYGDSSDQNLTSNRQVEVIKQKFIELGIDAIIVQKSNFGVGQLARSAAIEGKIHFFPFLVKNFTQDNFTQFADLLVFIDCESDKDINIPTIVIDTKSQHQKNLKRAYDKQQKDKLDKEQNEVDFKKFENDFKVNLDDVPDQLKDIAQAYNNIITKNYTTRLNFKMLNSFLGNNSSFSEIIRKKFLNYLVSIDKASKLPSGDYSPSRL